MRPTPNLASTRRGDRFGHSLAAGDFGRDGQADLAIGAPGEDEGGIVLTISEGAVNVIYASDAGLSSAGDQFWWQACDSLHDSADDSDRFGYVLAR